MKNEIKLTPISKVKKGEYIRFTENGPVYIRGDYYKETKKFESQKFDDINSFKYSKGTKQVYVNFEF